MIRFLPAHMVLAIHDDQIKEFGGLYGVRDAGLLDSALAQPQAQFGRHFLHATIYEMAAAYGFHVCKNHPFLDGNKRTAYILMVTFLRINGFTFSIDSEEAYEIMMAVAEGRITKQELAAWLEKVTIPPSEDTGKRRRKGR